MLATALSAIATAASAATLGTAIVTTDQAVLRAAPRDGAPQQAQLWQGEALEVRGERLDYLQVWDHRRERGGFVKASQVKRTAAAPAEAPELLAVLRFIREAPNAEALGIGVAAAYLQAAPAPTLRGEQGGEVLEALGTFADRLAQRASGAAPASKQAQLALSAHLEVAAGYGIRFQSYEQDGKIRLCYDGDAFRRVLAMPAPAPAKARAALALTQPQCEDPALRAEARHQLHRWQADVLEAVELQPLPPHLRARVQMRRASVWSTIAYERARLGQPADAAAQRALAELGGVAPSALTDDDQPTYNDAVMRVNASRWAAIPVESDAPAAPAARPTVVTQAGQPGETCVLLVDAKHGPAQPLARRCTYAWVWTQSASVSREGHAVALAVQPMAGWRELWVFRRDARQQWSVDVLPPASLAPELGYAEFAGWVPGGKEMLVAREARGEGKYRRSYEVIAIDSLVTRRQSADPGALGPFQRWQDPAWKRATVSLR